MTGKLEVGGVGTAEGLKEWCQPYWHDSGLKVKADAVGPGNSDHASFYFKKVPDLFFFTGYHPEYHTPKDVVSLINFEGGAKVADLVGRMALDAALRPAPFPFSDGRSESDKAEAKGGPTRTRAATRTTSARRACPSASASWPITATTKSRE